MIHTLILLQDSILVVFAGERTCVHAPQFSGVLNRKCCIRGNCFYKLPIVHEKCALHVRCNCRLFYSTITILPLWSSTCIYVHAGVLCQFSAHYIPLEVENIPQACLLVPARALCNFLLDYGSLHAHDLDSFLGPPAEIGVAQSELVFLQHLKRQRRMLLQSSSLMSLMQ